MEFWIANVELSVCSLDLWTLECWSSLYSEYGRLV